MLLLVTCLFVFCYTYHLENKPTLLQLNIHSKNSFHLIYNLSILQSEGQAKVVCLYKIFTPPSWDFWRIYTHDHEDEVWARLRWRWSNYPPESWWLVSADRDTAASGHRDNQNICRLLAPDQMSRRWRRPLFITLNWISAQIREHLAPARRRFIQG